MEGNVTLQLSAKSVGLFEAFYNSLKPIQMLYVPVEVAKPGYNSLHLSERREPLCEGREEGAEM